MPDKRSVLFSLILLILNLPDLFSSAATITGWRHPDLVYCSSEGGDSLIGASPSGKAFYFNGESYLISTILVRTSDGKAIFYPSLAGIGTHIIKYGEIGSNEVIVVVTVVPPVATSLSPFANVCSTSPAFSLFNIDSSNVSPKNGRFSGPGVDASGNFNPATAGPGVHTITYTAGVGGCLSSVSRPITVVSAPVTGFNPFPPVCEDTPPFLLTQGFPAGGTYSGPGVDPAGMFDQSVTGIGSFPVTYTYSNGTCINAATQNIVVSKRPAASFAGLANLYCPDDAGVNLNGNPASVTSSFFGPGITDNGNGIALFDPVIAGLGTHQVRYIYTSPEGCADTAYQQVQVGTNVIISGLSAQYCVNSANITISATPVGGTYLVAPGLTDNGDGTAVFSPSTAGQGIHTVGYTYIDGSGCINTRSLQVRVYTLPVPSIINLAASYCANNPSLTIRGNFQPSGTFNGPGISDNGNGTAIFNPLLLIAGNSYPVTYNYSDPVTGCAASVTSNVLINPLPSANITGDADICHGSAANLSISLSGSAPYSISLTDGTASFIYNNVAGPAFNTQVFPADTVSYSVSEITDSRGCKSAGNGTALINVLPVVSIIKQPVSQKACPGTDIALSLSAEGVNLKYQWEKDGIALAGATNATIALNDVQPADIGVYRCIISGDCGNAVTSNEASLELLSPVQLIKQPSDVYECEGTSSVLQVQATGSNLSWQWFRNNISLMDGPGYSGTTSADLNIGPLLTSMAGNYRVRVNGTCGTVESNTVLLKIDKTIIINSHPADVTICEGNNAIFRIEATGDNLSYQWQLNGSDIPGETTSVLVVANSSSADEGFYRCLVRSGCGSEVTTNAAQLSVLIRPVITSNPVGLLICEGDNAVFRVTVTGTANVYKWHRNGIPLADDARISGSAGSTLSITGVAGSDIGNYSCTIYSTCDSIASANALLSVDTSLAIITQPESLHKCPDDNAIFRVTATGNNLSYQWSKDGIFMPGQTGPFLVINNLKADDAATYHCSISNSCGKTVNSIDATLTIDLSTTITESPVDMNVCEGENTAFTIKASGTGLSYQWEFNGAPLTDNGSLTGSETQTLVITSSEKAHQGVYNCFIQGLCGRIRSVSASLLVNDTMTINKQPVSDTVCEGNHAWFSIGATGATAYQWQKDEVDIPGKTGESLLISNVSSSDSGVYRCIVFSFCDTLSSDGASLTVKKQPQITLQPVSLASCENLRVSFKAEVSGSDISWQWMRDGSPVNDGGRIQGSRSSMLVIDSLKDVHAGVYYANISGYCSSDIKSNSALLSVKTAPVILQQPENSVSCENQTTSFLVAVSGNVTYQWLKDNVNLPGRTSESLVLNNLSSADAGIYRCKITGQCGDIYSGDALLTVNQNPLITEQPVGITACEGGLITVRTTAVGSALSYHWKKDGTYLTDDAYISGSTGSFLSIQNSLPDHSGLYQCEITGVCDTVLSNSATIKVNDRIQITEQPVSVAQCEGFNAAFRVLATGSNLTYRWQKNGVNIPGANASQLHIEAVTEIDTGIYRCIINSDCEEIISEDVRLTVESSAVVTDQPVPEVHICQGNLLSAGFTAEGEGLTYQWYRDGMELFDDGTITGSDKSILTIDPAQPIHEGIYYCEVRNSCPGTATTGMQVWIDKPAVITEQPKNFETCSGNDIVLSLTTTGDVLSYQWKKNGLPVASATDPVYIINNASLSDSGSYQCVIISVCGEIISNAVQVKVHEPPVIITSPPAQVSECEGKEILLNVEVTGEAISYQWKKNGSVLGNIGNISGSQSPTLRLSAVTAMDVGVYTCEIVGYCDIKVTTPLTTVNVRLKPLIIFEPDDYSVLNGGNASFTTFASGEIDSWKWHFNGAILPDGGNVSGANTGTVQITGVTAADEGAYNIVVSGSCGEATSQPALLTMLTSSLITSQPAGGIKCEGESITITIETTGTGHSYQWKKNGIPLTDNARISGSLQAGLTVSGLLASDAGSYSCMVDGIENSVPALLFVNRTTEISYLAGENELCSGESITLFAEASGDSLEYNWNKDGIALTDDGFISGSITGALTIYPAGISYSGSYTCTVKGACGTQTSDPLVIDVADPVIILAQPRDTAVCEGQPLTISASAAGTVLSWQWYRNNIILTDNEGISGSKTQNLFIPDAGIADEGNYYCVVKGPCDSIVTNYATIDIRRNVTFTSQPENIDRCAGDLAVLTIGAGISNAEYQWQKDGSDMNDNVRVSGSETNTLRIEGLQLTDSGTYRCVVKGSCNSVQGNPVVLDISDTTSILSHPAGGTICEGTGFSFSVTTAGSSLSYQWIKDGEELYDNGTYSGTHSPMLVIDSAVTGSAGTYYCVVTGTCGSIESQYAILNVNRNTEVTTGSLSNRICEGKDLSISINATGSAISYQWQKDNNPLSDGLHYSGTTGANLHILNASKAESGIYQCLVKGSCGTETSAASQVTVLSPPSITVQPSDTSLCESDNLLLHITAAGDELEYSWKFNGNPIASISNELFIPDIPASGAGIYTCLVSNTICGSVNSNPAIIKVTSPAHLISSPADFSGCIGQQANFTVNVAGNSLHYQWQFNGSPLTDDLRVTGSETRSLVINNLSLSDQGVYRCVITDGCSNVLNSDAAILSVSEPLTLNTISAGDTLCEEQPVNLFVDVSGTNPVYQWYFNGQILSDGSEIQGTTTASLNIQNARIGNSGYYTCKITGTCGQIITTAPVSVLVIRTISITGHPVNLTRCAGDYAVLSVTALGDSLKYQWMKNNQVITDGTGISGSNSSLLLLTNLTTAESGSYYCEISNSCGQVNSQTASLAVNDYPEAAGAIDGETVVCQGSSGLVYSVGAIDGADTYEWTLPPGMVIVSGENTRQITVNFSIYESGGPVYVWGKNGCGAGLSSPVLSVTVNALPVAYAGENTGICDDESILTAFDPGLPATGSWQVISGPAVIDQPGQCITSVRGLRKGENRFSWTVVNNGCSLSDTVTIYNRRLHVEAGNDTSICDHVYRFEAELPLEGTGRWSIVTGAGYNIDRYNPNSMVSGLSKGTNVFKWSVVNSGCTSYDTVRITNNLPSESEAGNDQFLHNDNTNLSANIPETGTGEWTLLNGSAVIANPLKHNTQVSNLGQGQNIFAWTITHLGCVSEDTVIITNTITDSTDAGPDQVVCSNMVRLSAKNPYPGYGEWSVKRGSATFTKNSDYNTYAYNLMQGENVFTWTQNLNGITSDSVVIINNLPTAANAGVNVSVCFDSVMLNANLPYIGTGQWTIISGAGSFANRNSNITSVVNLARGRNDFKWTITNGSCTSSSVVTINNNRPTDAQAGFDVVTCEDSILLNPNVPTFGTGEWSVLSGSAKFTGNNAYDLGTNDNELIYTIRKAGCYSRDTLLITSHKPTQARLGSDQSICTDSAIITGNLAVTGTGVWSLQSGSADISDTHAPSFIARNIGQGENIFRWTIDYMGCSSYDEMTISNDFVQAYAGTDQTGCFNRTVLQANNPGYSSGVWTVMGGSTGASITDPNSFNSTVENLAPGPNMLRWTISKNGCESYDEIVITNNRPTTAFAGENAYLCTDEIKLRANPVTIGTGTWSVLSGSGTFTDDHDPAATVRGLASGINIFRWTSENSGCVSTDEVIVTNNLPVNVYAGLDQVLCDDSTVLYANPPVIGNGTWSILYGAGSFGQPAIYNTPVTGLSNGVNRLIWTVSTTGCSDADTVEITNNLPTKAIAGSDFPVCNSTGNLSANRPLYGTGIWTLVSGAGRISDPGAAQTIAEDLALGNNTLQWTITNGSCVSSDQLTIANNSPTVADAGESSEVCGETAILYANSPQVGTGSWSVISGTGIPDDPLNFNTTVRGLNFGQNTLRWTTRNGDCYTSDEIIVTNNLADVYAGEDQVVYNPQANLSGNNPASGAGQWNLLAGQGNITSAGSFTSHVTDLGAGLNTFEWTITNGNCTARDITVIHFKIMPVPGFAANITEGCPGLTVDFTNTTRYGTTYMWDMGDGFRSVDVNPRYTFNYAGQFRVRLTAFGPDNRVVTRDTVITVHTKPVADFHFAPDTAVIGEPVRLYNASFAGASEYYWDFSDSEFSTEENPVHYYQNSGNFDITLMVNSGFGCADTITRTIMVAEDGLIIFPNAFTPDPGGPNGGAYSDGDFSNDVFHPYCENIKEYHLEIYSRWGVLLFETDDINIGWDGYYKGVLLARDVYVWKATGKFASGKQFLKTGNVILITNE